MPEPKLILIGAAAIAFFVSAIASLLALLRFARRGEPLLGFAFHHYYWGAMRTEHPGVFWTSIGGALAGIALIGIAAALA